MLVKLTGGGMAVFGFAAGVLSQTRHAGGGGAWFLVGGGGIALFHLASRALARRCAGCAATSSTPSRSRSMSLVAWGLLLLFVLIFLGFSWFATR